MATIFLSANANSSVAVYWTTSGGSTTVALTSADTIDLNAHTLTVDATLTCAAIIGTTGTLAVSGSQTINATIGDASSGFACTLNGASQTVALVGNVIAGITANRITVSGASTTLNVTGNVTGGATFRGINCSVGAVNVTGNCTGGTGSNGAAVISSGSGVVTVTGTVTGGSTVNVGGYGAQVTSGTLTINGTISGGSAASNTVNGNYGVLITGGTLNHTGSRTSTATSSAVVLAGGTDTWNGGVISVGGQTATTYHRYQPGKR
jgi:hypothetical protein